MTKMCIRDRCGDFYVKLRVDNAEGYAEEELKVEVKELTPQMCIRDRLIVIRIKKSTRIITGTLVKV